MTKVQQRIQKPLLFLMLIIGMAMAGLPLPAFAQETSAPFRRLDLNKDGRLSGSEFELIPNELKKQLDLNQDGEILAVEDIQHQVRSLRPSKTNVFYAGNKNPRQSLDIWTTANLPPNANLPVVVWIHGGAWRSGNKSHVHDIVKRMVLTKRYVGVSLNYRLSQEKRWPAQLHDCKAAIRWIHANAKSFGGDRKRIFLMGSSAGGHLVSMLTTTMGDKAQEGSVGSIPDRDVTLIGGISLYGPTDFLRMNDFPSTIDHDAANSPESQLIGAPIQSRPELVKLANPITFVDPTDPPLLLIHGTNDKLVCFNQSQLLHDAIKAAGGQSTLVTIQGGGHGGFTTPQITALVMSYAEYLIGARKQMPKDSTLPHAKSP